MPSLVALVFGALACWRVTHLFNAEDGPWDLLVRFRRLFGEGVIGKMLDCFYCLSLWVAIPFAIVLSNGWRGAVLLWLSISAAAILLQRATDGR